ncbi:MAG: hypothetical protein K2W79_12905 [Hydrotalea flava]|nr:hypothetical protein [Hydrotalea flava]
MFKLSKTLAASYRQHLLIDKEYLYLAKETELFKIELTSGLVSESITLLDKIDSLANNNEEVIVYFSSKSKRIKKNGLVPIDDFEYEELIPYQINPSGNLFLISIGEDIFNRQCGGYDIKEKKTLWINGNISNPIVLRGHFFTYINDKIQRFDLNTGILIWTCLIQELGKYYNKIENKWHDGEVYSFLGIYNGFLWVCLNNGLLIGIDISTGSIMQKVGVPNQYPPELHMLDETIQQNFFYNHYSIFDEKNGKIIRLWHAGYSNESFNWIFETDLNTNKPELTISKVKNTTGIPFVIDGNPCPIWPFDDEFIYVCNYRDYKIALFNRKTKQIEWVHEIEVEPPKRSFIIKMEVQGNRWYILDNSKTLYVYERE